MRSVLSAGLSGKASLSAIFEAATLIAGRAAVTGFVSAGFTATLIAGFAGDLSVVLTASFGPVPRPSAVTLRAEVTALLEPIVLDFRVSFPFIRFKDIIPSDSGEAFLIPVPLLTSDVKNV